MTSYQRLCQQLSTEPRSWLVTGVAGFIGSHLLETLLELDQCVVGIDLFTTGSRANLEEVQARVSPERWARFAFHEGSVADLDFCRAVSAGVDYVLHQAGFVSVPLSLENPLACHETNVTGTLNIFTVAREQKIRRVVYASSSAVYGDDPRQPKREEEIGRPLSPYGASKRMGEIYAQLFSSSFGLETVGLRYFNVFGPRQNPTGGYAAVIPLWIDRMLRGVECLINGDGGATRDFCPVSDVVQANLLAAATSGPSLAGEVFNVARGSSNTLNELHALLAEKVSTLSRQPVLPIRYGPERAGDIRHSSADIGKIRRMLGFEPSTDTNEGLEAAIRWQADRLRAAFVWGVLFKTHSGGAPFFRPTAW